MKTFGTELKRLRLNNGLSGATVAKTLGISRQFYCQLEKGHRTRLGNILAWVKLGELFALNKKELDNLIYLMVLQN